MNIYALLLFLYFVFYAAVAIMRNGMPQYVTPVKLLLSQAFSFSMLILGGFFAMWGWPQVLILCGATISWGIFFANGFDTIETKYNAIMMLIMSVIGWWVYYCGGFWIFLPK